MQPRIRAVVALLALASVAASCNSIPLFAPSSASITLTAGSRVLALNSSIEITAAVLQNGGNSVQNGTTIRFTTDLGTFSPAEVQTRNGMAVTTFMAGNISGTANVRATSGAAGGSTTGTGTGSSAANTLTFTIGAAATNSVSVSANPSTVPAAGGTVNLIALVLDTNSQPVTGVPVTFSATKGTLSAITAPSDGNGLATVQLTTSVSTAVTASAGGKTSASVTIDVLGTPSVTLTCGSSISSCTQTAGTAVSFTANRGSGTTALVSVSLDFGDGSAAVSLGSLASPTTVVHIYSTAGSYTATLHATDVNGQTTSASDALTIAVKATLVVDLTASTTTAGTANQVWTFTATVTPTDTLVESYTWDFGDGSSTVVTPSKSTTHVIKGTLNNGPRTAYVDVKTVDGRTVRGRFEFIVSGLTG